MNKQPAIFAPSPKSRGHKSKAGKFLVWDSSHTTLIKIICAVFLFWVGVKSVEAEIIPADRRADWQGNIGVPGGIPNRTSNCVTSACNTLWGGSVTSASINNAINSAPDNTVVRIPAGTFNLNSVVVVSRDNVTVRGQGVGTTILRVGDYPAFQTEEYGTTASGSVLSGYSKGSNTITVSNAASVVYDGLIFIYQDDDPNLIWNRSNQNEQALRWGAYVTGVNGNTITFAPNIPYGFSAGFNPRFEFHDHIQTHVGFEDMTIDGGTSEPWRSIYFIETYACWVKNIEVKNFGDTAIGAGQSVNGEIRGCYAHDTNTDNDGYGVYLANDYGGVGTVSGFLVEENIFNNLWLGVMFKGASFNVVAYNYAINTSIGFGWHQTPGFNSNHGAHGYMNLFEGNIGQQFQNDGYHGSTSHTTIFRNWFHGLCPSYCQYPEGNRKMIDLCRFSWYENIVANVLGDASWNAVAYEMAGTNFGYEDGVIYRFGYPNMGNNDYSLTNSPSNGDDGGYDPNVKQTLIRHGNYDYFNDATMWDSGIADHNLPSSYYLSAKPVWFGNLSWPPIGPDRSPMNGLIPAQARFNGQGYPYGSEGDTTAPASPSGLMIR